MTRHLVVGIDGSQAASHAAEWAADEAAARGLDLLVVHAVPLAPHLMPTLPGTGAWRGGARHLVDAQVSALSRRRPGLPVEGRVVEQTPAEALVEAGRSAELLVVAARGLHGFTGLQVGSVALRVADRAPCPVVVLPPGPVAPARRPEVVLGVDARHPDPEAACLAFDAASRRGARLRAVHAWELPAPYAAPWAPYRAVEEDRAAWEDQEVQLLDDALRPWREKYPGVAVLADVRLFHPAEALVNASSAADLLVMGRGAAPGSRLSAAAHAVVHHARCPVLLAPRG
ncbi:universal stress protein [Streptomyces sp. B1866]|uniref:universal stress protein n=1 Tax=Streptomyces sp. B1866 TaxID=3075431 RepID=UPI00288D2192|nr:universal stress protein [Streptomyces sp. B1866]MDT3399382.1 universal stress protein [Streptomyces sp. B1866]